TFEVKIVSPCGVLDAAFEIARDLTPRVALVHESSSLGAKRGTSGRVVEQVENGTSERIVAVGRDEVSIRDEAKAFGANRGRDDGLGHRGRFEDLQAAPPTHAGR